MPGKKYVLLFIYVVVILNNCAGENSEEEKEEEDIFVPTDQWQEIKKGQKIPKGLHVRIDLETGLREAKLIDDTGNSESDSKKKSLLVVQQPDDDLEAIDGSKVYTPEEIEKKLRNIKGEEIKAEEPKQTFRSYEEIKKEIDELNLNLKTENEILKELFEEYQQETKNKEIAEEKLIRIITDLDYLAHQFDNALDFLKLDGFNRIIYKNFNSSNNEVKQETLKLFSSLVQNNPKVKIHALETGSIPILLRLLSSENSEQTLSRTVTALSCLLRMFPFAQINFVENGGLSIMSRMFKTDFINLQVKVAVFVSDLLTERKNDKQNFEHFKNIDLESLLMQHNWCDNLNSLLEKLIVADADHDSIEKCLLAMESLLNQCGNRYNTSVLTNLLKRYRALATGEDDDYYENVANICEIILNFKKSDYVKTEL